MNLPPRIFAVLQYFKKILPLVESLSCALQVKAILWDAALLGASDVIEMAAFLDFTPILEIIKKWLTLNIVDVR